MVQIGYRCETCLCWHVSEETARECEHKLGRFISWQYLISNIQNFGKNHASYWGNALAGEVGEVCNLIKKYERDNIDINAKLSLELADVFIYLVLVSQYFRIDLPKAIIDKQEIISKRQSDRVERITKVEICKDHNIANCHIVSCLSKKDRGID